MRTVLQQQAREMGKANYVSVIIEVKEGTYDCKTIKVHLQIGSANSYKQRATWAVHSLARGKSSNARVFKVVGSTSPWHGGVLGLRTARSH